MKCPFRVIKETTYKNVKDSTVKEVFAECYGSECPFYYKALDGKEKCKRDSKVKW